MVQIVRTHDMDLVRLTVTNKSVWRKSADDGISPEHFHPLDLPNSYYLAAIDEKKYLGMFTLHPLNSICYEIHVCLLPVSYGEKAYEAGQKVLAWIADNTPALKIFAQISADNPLAIRYARRAGFKDEGINRLSFRKGGVLHDQVILGITRGEICLRQQPQS